MRFPLACLAWPLGTRVAAAHDGGVDGRGADVREKGPMQATSGSQRDKTRPAARLDWINRYKTLPAARLGGPPGTKLSQQAALAGPPGTKLSQRAPKRRFRAIFRMQGELFTASATNTTSREKKVTHQHSTSASQHPTSASQHPTSAQQRAALQISHAIRLRELSTKPRNVAIPTIRIQSLKYPKGNCMRNYRADGAGRGARPRGRRAATGASQAKVACNSNTQVT